MPEGGEQAENYPQSNSRASEALPPEPSPPVPASTTPKKELLPPPPPAEHPKLPRSVPTPLVIAQKISETLAGNEGLSPTSPLEGRPGEWRTPTPSASRLGEHGEHGLWPRHVAQSVPKVHRFPSNISVTNSAGKDFNKTISKAAVNVQERKAQVLANISGASFLAAGDAEERGPRADAAAPSGSSPGRAVRAQGRPDPARASRAVQTERPPGPANGFQSVHEALRREPSAFAPTGKTITFRPELARQDGRRSLYEPRHDCGQDARGRAGSLPRALGFRPQGITVQFSGRGSTEEARREALRKLGLLKENC